MLHWEQNDKQSEPGLFIPYINMFLQIKVQALGYPSNIETLKEKENYIMQYNCKEGVLLNGDCITKNPGLRSIGKLALNSFYGKFGQKSNMKKTFYITQYEKLYNLLTDRTKKIKDFHMCLT